MSKQEKLFKRIERLNAISFDEAVRFLLAQGYCERVAGSHHSFSKAGVDTVTIKHRCPIHTDAVKDLRRILRHVLTVS